MKNIKHKKKQKKRKHGTRTFVTFSPLVPSKEERNLHENKKNFVTLVRHIR